MIMVVIVLVGSGLQWIPLQPIDGITKSVGVLGLDHRVLGYTRRRIVEAGGLGISLEVVKTLLVGIGVACVRLVIHV